MYFLLIKITIMLVGVHLHAPSNFLQTNITMTPYDNQGRGEYESLTAYAGVFLWGVFLDTR